MNYHAELAKPLPSVEFLEEYLDYDRDTGLFFWKERPLSHFKAGKFNAEQKCSQWNKRFASKKAGYVDKGGYLIIHLSGERYRAHRLAWKMVHGVDPLISIDHINRDPLDNRIANLRDVCMLEQMNNKGTNNDLPRGVMNCSYSDKYRAIPSNTYLGEYDTVEEAAEVAKYGYEYIAFMRNSGYGLNRHASETPQEAL